MELDTEFKPSYEPCQFYKVIVQGRAILTYMAENPAPHFTPQLAKRFNHTVIRTRMILASLHICKDIAPVKGTVNGWGVTDRGRKTATVYSNNMSRVAQVAKREEIRYEPVDS